MKVLNDYCITHSRVPLDVHCCNNKYIMVEVLYLKYNKRISSAKGMCPLHVKKIFISILLSLAIFHSPKCWGKGHKSRLYGSSISLHVKLYQLLL